MPRFWHRRSRKSGFQNLDLPDIEREGGKAKDERGAASDNDGQAPGPARPTKGVNINFESDLDTEATVAGGDPTPGSKPTVWSMYLERAFKLDLALVESWREDMDSLLLFSAIFAASVTAFIIESYKKLLPDQAAVTTTLLLRISVQLSQTNETLIPPLPTPFRPSTVAIFCNICWFLSLILSLSCALGAILVRQSVLNYHHNTQEELAPPDRARMRHYLFMGVTKWKFATFVETLPVILHMSLFLFMAGLVAFVLDVNRIVTATIVVLCASCLTIYWVLTILPLRHPDCPYQTPLSPLLPLASAAAVKVWNATMKSSVSKPPPDYSRSQAKRKDILTASLPRHELDVRLIQSLWSLLTESREIVLLLNAIPDFIRSFPESLNQKHIPHRIVLDAAGTKISRILQASITSDGRTQVPRGVESVAVACTGAMSFIAQTSATRQPQIDWPFYFSLDSTMWKGLHTLSLRHQRRPTKVNLDLALQAHGFLLLVSNYQLEQSRHDPHPDNTIAILRRRVCDQLCDASARERWSPDLLQKVSELCQMCWLQDLLRWGEELYHDINWDWTSRSVDIPYPIGRTDKSGSDYGHFPNTGWVEHVSIGRARGVELVHVAMFGPVFKWSLDADYLLLLYLALKQKWLYAQDLSEEQTRLALAMMVPIAENARITFASAGRKCTDHICWLFNRLSIAIYSSTKRFYKLFSPLCAIILFPDGEERKAFQDKLLQHLSQSSLDGRRTLLDVVGTCLRELIIDSHISNSTSTLHLLGVCLVVGMPRNGEDLRCMLHKADSYRHPDFLYKDILLFRPLWLSCFYEEGTPADICSIINVLPDPLFSSKTRAFLRVLLCILDAEDISYMRHLGYVDDWVWDQLPPKQQEPPRMLSGTAPEAGHTISAKKRIGSRPGWKRRLSLSFPLTDQQRLLLRVGVDRSAEPRKKSFSFHARPRNRSQSLPRSWTDEDQSNVRMSFNRYGGSSDQLQADERWKQRVRLWVAMEEKRERRRRRRWRQVTKRGMRDPDGDDDNCDSLGSDYDYGYGSDHS